MGARNITIKHDTAFAALLKVFAPWGVLLTSGSLMAQPAAPSFEGHRDLRSTEPSASSLSYDWSCGEIKRSIEFNLRYRETPDKVGVPRIFATWSIGRYMREGELVDQVDDELSSFVSTLGAINYIAGRCFNTEGEVRISGMIAESNVMVMHSFRIR